MGLFPLIVLKILEVAQRRKIFREVLESVKLNLKVLALVFLTKYQQTWPLNSMQLRKQRLWRGFFFFFWVFSKDSFSVAMGER